MARYIHGTTEEEQNRLAKLNSLLNDRCMAKLEFAGHERVLDIGCGLGIFTRMLSKEVPKGLVVGVEKELTQIERGHQLATNQGLEDQVDIRQGSAYQLPLSHHEWGTFDVVFIRFLLEHLHDPYRALSQADKALGDGGKIILIDDDHANFRITPEQTAFARLWTAYCEVYNQLGNDPFIGRKLITMLRETRFTDLKIDFILFGATADQSSFMDYADNLIGILTGAKKEMVEIYGEEFNYEEDMEMIKAWKHLPDATLWYAANYAEGRK